MPATDDTCLSCVQPGNHFVSPSMGKFGYYTCEGAPLSRGRSAQTATQQGPVGGAAGKRMYFPYHVSNLPG